MVTELQQVLCLEEYEDVSLLNKAPLRLLSAIADHKQSMLSKGSGMRASQESVWDGSATRAI